MDRRNSRVEVRLTELVVTALWEISLQIFGEVLMELGLSAIGEPFRRSSRAHPVVAGSGVALFGAAAGVLTSLIWPARILQPGPFPGTSLMVSPILTGIVMNRYGQWREDRGLPRSYIGTFWGGALFAFSMALVRFIWVTGYGLRP